MATKQVLLLLSVCVSWSLCLPMPGFVESVPVRTIQLVEAPVVAPAPAVASVQPFQVVRVATPVKLQKAEVLSTASAGSPVAFRTKAATETRASVDYGAPANTDTRKAASVDYGAPADTRKESGVEAYPLYNFGYSVTDARSGDAKARQEERDGDKVSGFYTVADPDGRVRRVEYTADKSTGFQATVTYDGEPGPVAIPFDVVSPAVVVRQQSDDAKPKYAAPATRYGVAETDTRSEEPPTYQVVAIRDQDHDSDSQNKQESDSDSSDSFSSSSSNNNEAVITSARQDARIETPASTAVLSRSQPQQLTVLQLSSSGHGLAASDDLRFAHGLGAIDGTRVQLVRALPVHAAPVQVPFGAQIIHV